MAKGQAAMEYLVSYGWVLVVVLASLGILMAMGVVNPTKWFPSHCEFEDGLYCADYRLNSTALVFVVHNAFEIDLKDVNITVVSNDGLCNESVWVGDLLDDYSTGILVFCSGMSMPERMKGELRGQYRFPTETVVHTARGGFTLHREG